MSETNEVSEAALPDEIDAEFMFVADAAQAVGGKLYVVGGGWSHLWLPAFPGRAPIPFFIAAALQVPWNRTNQRVGFTLELRDADEGRVGDEPVAHGELEQGRPPGLRPGSAQRVMMAIPVNAEFPERGRYFFVMLVGDREVGKTAIEVGDVPPQMVQMPR